MIISAPWVHDICHQHHRHHLPQASIQFDYGASPLRKWKPSWVFVTMMCLRNHLRKNSWLPIMVMYRRTIDILCCHLRGLSMCIWSQHGFLCIIHMAMTHGGKILAHGPHHGAIRTLTSRLPSICWCMHQGILWKEEIFRLKGDIL